VRIAMPIAASAITAGSGSDCQVMYSPDEFHSTRAPARAPNLPGAPTLRAIATKATTIVASATRRPQRASPKRRPPAARPAESGDRHGGRRWFRAKRDGDPRHQLERQYGADGDLEPLESRLNRVRRASQEHVEDERDPAGEEDP